MKRRGFSMIEALLSLAVAGLILASATNLLVVFSRQWAERPAAREAFDAHVNGVARFLTAVLEEATVPVLNPSGNDAVDLQRPVGFSDSDDPLIHFYLREAPPLFVWPGGTATRVHAYLLFEEGEGLSILWFSELQELEKNEEGRMEPEGEDELFKTLISPLCDEIYYCYYGEEDDGPDDFREWDHSVELKEKERQTEKFRLPAFVKLVFRGEGKDLDRTITIPIERLSPSGLKEDGR